MPVLGHGLVGLATGLATVRDQDRPVARALWIPSAVVLAYLPDIMAQLGIAVGWRDAGVVTHSICFAVGASIVVAALLARFAAVSFVRSFGLVLLTIVLHELMDVLQSTNRMLWWPLSTHPARADPAFIPRGARSEALLFASLFCVFLAVRFGLRRFRTRDRGPVRRDALPVDDRGPAPVRLVRLGYVITVSVFATAGGLHVLQSARDRQYQEAWSMVARRDYAGALEHFGQAQRWPGVGRPGRIDYGKAEAYLGLGERGRAEHYYLASVCADPHYLWAVADLAVFYASSSESAGTRRDRVAPYSKRLRADFADHPRQPHVLARVQRKLAEP